MSEASAKKDVQKLQRAIVDGLQDVKAHNICVFNTEHLSPLFERVIVAGGSSHRQTRALAASVRDKVRASGFAKPRVEGEDNGEWIVVDCGPAVAHIMQPAIRQYYNLEEIWGDKPVRLKGPGALKKPQAPKQKPAPAKTGKGPSATKKETTIKPKATAKKTAAKRPVATTTPAKKSRTRTPVRKTVGKKGD